MKDNIDTYYTAFKSHLQKTISVSEEEFEHVISHFSTKYLKKKEYLLRLFRYVNMRLIL